MKDIIFGAIKAQWHKNLLIKNQEAGKIKSNIKIKSKMIYKKNEFVSLKRKRNRILQNIEELQH